MAATILDPGLEERLIAERKANGLDRYDEVWDGVYVMAPWPNDEHQRIAGFLQTIIGTLFQLTKLGEMRPGINLSDRPDNWTTNFRVPDVVVFLKSGSGVCHGAFWTGGPDFAVEVVSEGEDPEAKFEFYARLATRELLLIHRDPWRLELYAPHATTMRLLAASEANQPGIASVSVGLTFALRGPADNPDLVVQHPDGRAWTL
jgi:Uma2 family endonuclease